MSQLKEIQHRLFTEKDLAGFYEVTTLMLQNAKKMMGTEAFVIVALGRSPSAVTEFMKQAFKLDVMDLPLGGLSGFKFEQVGGLTKQLVKHFSYYLPPSKIKNKSLVVVDYAHGGNSLRIVCKWLKKYISLVNDFGSKAGVWTVPISMKPKNFDSKESLIQGYDTETRAAHRLLKVLFTEIDKDIYSRHRSIKYEAIDKGHHDYRFNYVQKMEKERLEIAMTLALKTVDGSVFTKGTSPYLKKRKYKKNNFSPIWGYDPIREEQWVNTLLKKSANEYHVKTVVPYKSKAASDYRWQQRIRPYTQFWGQLTPRGKIAIPIFLLLLFAAMLYLIKTLLGRMWR